MTYEELYDKANRMLDSSEITIGEYGDMIEPLKAEIETRWIPVSKEPVEGTYLITGQHGKNRYVDIATYDYGEWSSYSDEYKVDRIKHKVIAYMPLPKPYMIDNGGE